MTSKSKVAPSPDLEEESNSPSEDLENLQGYDAGSDSGEFAFLTMPEGAKATSESRSFAQ
ncbi:hypothetical protein TrRE_jg764, partial [Triparma retinervis]